MPSLTDADLSGLAERQSLGPGNLSHGLTAGTRPAQQRLHQLESPHGWQPRAPDRGNSLPTNASGWHFEAFPSKIDQAGLGLRKDARSVERKTFSGALNEEGGMRVEVNGFTEDLQPGTTLQQLIEQFHDQSPSLIAEVNGRFIYPQNYSSLEINDGDRVELIHPAFGG